MRRLSLLAAVLLAAAPLLTGCADDFATDAPSALETADATSFDAVAPTTAASPEAASAVMHCAYLNGPEQLNPGQGASYTSDINSWCGSMTGLVEWSIVGDGRITALPGLADAKTASGPSTIQVRADNVSYGSFTLTASFRNNAGSYRGSISKQVTVGEPPPPVVNLNLTATNSWRGIRLTWNPAAIPSAATRCEISLEQYVLGGGPYSLTTTHVACGAGTYLDGGHTTTGASSLERGIYRFYALDANGQNLPIPNNSVGLYLIDKPGPDIDVAFE